MSDPFVQRMMARTQARQNVLGKVSGESNKENTRIFDNNETSTAFSSTAIPSKSYNLSNVSSRSSPLKKISDEPEDVLCESSNITQTHHISSTSASSLKDIDSNINNSSNSRVGRRRYQHLAERSKQMEQWEDDYTYHSVCGGSAKEVETRGLGLHTNLTLGAKVDKQHGFSGTKHGTEHSSNKENFLSTYYYGDCQLPKDKSGIDKNICTSPVLHAAETRCGTPKSQMDASFHSAISTFSPQSLSRSSKKKKTPSASTSQFSPTSASKNAFPSPPLTPTRKLQWDRQLLKSLIDASDDIKWVEWEVEAQGFTPSASLSRLAYEFRDRSPIKKSNEEAAAKAHKTSSAKSPEKAKPPRVDSAKEPPKIVSVMSKERERSVSPSKVSEMRSRWEQHIRDASPDRQNIERQPSPSPTRKFQSSASRSRSPVKQIHSSSASSLANSNVHRFVSPVKSSQELCSDKKDDSVAPASYGFNRGSGFRVSLRSVSPKKPISLADVIKGEAPMPEATPVVNNPSASVKERAAAFSSIAGPKMTEKDPAELSVQDRKTLFEKKKGDSLVPKGPFGQCIPEKTLNSGAIPKPPAVGSSRSYEVPKTPKSTSSKNINRTFVSTPGASKQHPTVANTGNEEEPIGSSVSDNRRRFEHVQDNWRATDINSKVMDERKKEINLLMNRFRRPQQTASVREASEMAAVDETETEYPDSSDDSSPESDVFASVEEPLLGPPKPPRVGVTQRCAEVVMPPPPPMPGSPVSPSKRLNSTELDDSCPRSPSKEYVPKVKPGCLFPSLSDIESQHSEAVESDEDNKNSSFAESVLTCASGYSLGTHIQRMAQANAPMAPPSAPVPKQLSSIRERGQTKGTSAGQELSASTLEALEAIDEALDEAFDDEPTPPKRGRQTGDDAASSSYRTPKVRKDSSNSSDSSCDVSLAHSISMYRRQKPSDVYVTPVRQITRISEFNSPKDSPISPSATIGSRIRELQEEEEHQLTVISQASSAISVVAQHPEQHGTPQHIEALRLFLVSTQKRQSALNEITRLKTDGALGKRNYWAHDEDSSRGSISISNISLPLKQEFLDKSLIENRTNHFLVLVKHRDQVITSQVQTAPECVVEGAVTFPNLMALHNLSADFSIYLEVYRSTVESLHATGFKKEHSRLKLTPLKRLHRESKIFSPMSSPAAPHGAKDPSFTLIGFANLDINTLTRNAWTLEKVPLSSPISGHLLMRVAVTMEGGVSEKSFLTMFEDVGGFGAWNRRWCVLTGPFIKYWSYPDDETKKDCIDTLDLRMCTTRKVEQVSRDICARNFTVQLTFMRPKKSTDKTDLIHEVKNNALISRILLSADSKDERILWCNKLNKALANIRAWDPDALKPEDFHV